MGVSKVVFNGSTIFDITKDTVTSDKLAKGATAHDKAGNAIVGTLETDVLFSGYVAIDFRETSGIYSGMADCNFTISPNETYEVTFDGTKYTLDSFEYDGVTFLGNPEIIGMYFLQPSDAPFILFTSAQRSSILNIATMQPIFCDVEIKSKKQLNLQSKTVTPSSSKQTVVADSSFDGLSSVTVNPIPNDYIGNNKNTQGYHGVEGVRQTSYTATAVKLTVKKTGTYKVSWMGFRNTNTGTSGSQLYINGVAYGTANTTFTSTYGQVVTLSGVSLKEGDEIVVRARARSTSYYMYVGNLIIEQT